MPSNSALDVELTATSLKLQKVSQLMTTLKKAIGSREDQLLQLKKASAEYQQKRTELPEVNDEEVTRVMKELDVVYQDVNKMVRALQNTSANKQGEKRLVYLIDAASITLAKHLKSVKSALLTLDIPQNFSYLANSPQLRQELETVVDEYKKNILNDPSQNYSAEQFQQEGEKLAAKVNEIFTKVDKQTQQEVWRMQLKAATNIITWPIILAIVIGEALASLIIPLLKSTKNESHLVSKASFFKVTSNAEKGSVPQPEEALKQGENPTTPEKKL